MLAFAGPIYLSISKHVNVHNGNILGGKKEYQPAGFTHTDDFLSVSVCVRQ